MSVRAGETRRTVGYVVPLPYCPHCGFDLRQTGPVEIGDATYEMHAGLSINGVAVLLTASEQIIVQTLMLAKGSPISRDVLANRADIDGSDRNVDTHVKRIRRKLEAVGAGNLIEARYGLGYRWRA